MERSAYNLTTARDNVTKDNMNKWFWKVDFHQREKALMSVTKETERVFNTDESAFYLPPIAGKVIASLERILHYQQL